MILLHCFNNITYFFRTRFNIDMNYQSLICADTMDEIQDAVT